MLPISHGAFLLPAQAQKVAHNNVNGPNSCHLHEAAPHSRPNLSKVVWIDCAAFTMVWVDCSNRHLCVWFFAFLQIIFSYAWRHPQCPNHSKFVCIVCAVQRNVCTIQFNHYAVNMKAQQWLIFLRVLRKYSLDPSLLLTFYRASIGVARQISVDPSICLQCPSINFTNNKKKKKRFSLKSFMSTKHHLQNTHTYLVC